MTRRNWVAVLVLLSFVSLAFFPLVRAAGAQPARIKLAVLGVENKTDAPLSGEEATAALQKAFSGSDRYSLINPDEVAKTLSQSGLSSDSSTSIRAMILGKILEADQVVLVSLNRYAVKGAKIEISAQASFYDGTDGRFLRSANLSGEGSGIQDAFSNVAAGIPNAATSASTSGSALTKSGTLLAILGVAGIVAAVSGNKGGGGGAPSSSGGSSSSSSSSGGPTPTPPGSYTMGPITKESSVTTSGQTTVRFSVTLTPTPPVDSEGKGAPVVWAISGSTAVVAVKGTATSNTDFTGKAYVEVTSAVNNTFQVTASNRTLTGSPSMNTNVAVDTSGNVTTGQSVTPTSARVTLEANPAIGLYASSQKATTITVTAYKTATELAPDGTPVTMTQSPSNFGTFEGGATATTVNGVAKFNYSSQNSGNVAMFASSLNKQSNLLNLSFGTPSLTPIVQTNNQVDIPSAGRSTQYFKVSVTPAVAGYEVQWTSTTGNIVPKGTVSNITNSAGEAVVAVDVPFGTSYQLTAILKIGSQTYSPQSLGITVAADGSTSSNPGSARVVLSAQSQVLIADNVNLANLTAVVMDASGKLLSGIPVQFASNPIQGTFVDANPGLTDANGQVTMRYRTNLAGQVSITGTGTIAGQSVVSNPLNMVSGIPAVILISDKDTIIANNTETATLTAAVTDPSGAPASGKLVTFTADPSATGEFVGANPATTDSTGLATIKYRSLNRASGNVTLTATANFGTSPLIFKGTKALTLTPDTHTVVLESSSDTLLADDLTLITLTATVVDVQQNPSPGVQVTFTGTPATSGSFVPASGIATTGTDGKATIQYKSRNRATGSVTLKATASIIPLTFFGTKNITQTLDAHTITLSAAPPSIVADDTTKTTISATVMNASGNADQDIPVTFTATPGTTGEFVGQNPVPTNAQGVATIQYKSKNRAFGSVTVTGRADVSPTLSFTGNTPVTLTRDVYTVNLTPSTTSLVADDAALTTLTATVVNGAGNLVQDKLVTFAQNPALLGASGVSGVFVGPTSVLTNQNGEATVRFKSLNMASGTANINASINVSSDTFTSPYQQIILSPDTCTMTLDRTNAAIVADGTTTSTVTATVRDLAGKAPPIIAPPITVTFTANPAGSGTLDPPVTVALNADGKASVTYHGTVPGPVTITGAANQPGLTSSVLFQGTTTVTLVAPTSPFMLSVNPSHILADGQQNSILTAIAYNGDGSPGAGNVLFQNTLYAVDGTRGTFYDVTGNPVVGGSANVPLVNGEASIRLRAPFAASNTVINATWGAQPVQTATVFFDSSFVSDAASIALSVPTSPDPAPLQVADTGGTSSVLVTADVKKADGNPVADGTVVTFGISGPGASAGAHIETTKTTASGKAVATLYAGTTPGEIVVNATSGSVTVNGRMAKVASGPPQAVSANISAGQFHNIDGLIINQVQTSVDVMVRDKYGNPVPDGTPVSLTCDYGTVDTGPFATINGLVASITYRSGNPKPPNAPSGNKWVTINVSAGMSGGANSHYVDTTVLCVVSGPAVDGLPSPLPAFQLKAGETKTITLNLWDALHHAMAQGTIVKGVLPDVYSGTIPDQTVAEDNMGENAQSVLTFLYTAPQLLGGTLGANQRLTSLTWECKTPHDVSKSIGFLGTCNVTLVPGDAAALTLTADKTTIKANNLPVISGAQDAIEYVRLDADVKDRFGNPIDNAIVNPTTVTFRSSFPGVLFTTTQPGNSVITPPAGKNPSDPIATGLVTSGRVTIYAVGSNVGAATIDAVSGTLNQSVPVTLTAGSPASTIFTTQPASVVGDNVTPIRVSAHVYDNYNTGGGIGHDCTGVNVLFSTDHPEMTSFASSSVATGADGIASTNLTGRYEGPNASQAVVATANASGASNTANVSFTRTPVTAVNIRPDVTTVHTVGGSSPNQSTLRIQAMNAQGRPVQGVVIKLSSSLEHSTLTNPGAPDSPGRMITLPATGSDGYVATDTVVTSLAPGVASITAAVPADNFTSPATLITFTGVPLNTNSSFTIIPSSVPGNNSTAATCRVLLRNNDGYVCPDVKVNFRIISGTGATLSASQATTSADGSCTVTITGLAEDTDHTVQVQATLPDFTAFDTYLPFTQSVTFTKLPPSTVQVGPAGQSIVADGAGNAPLVIRVLNSLNNGIPANSVTISSNLPNSYFGGVPGQQTITGTTNADGYVFTSLQGTQSGTATVSAAANSASGSTTVALRAGTPSIVTSTLNVVGNTIKGDLTESATVTATILDANRNPVSGNSVTFTLSGAQALTTGFGATMAGSLVVTTGADGTASTTVKGSRSGSVTVSALPGAPYAGAALSSALTLRFVPSSVVVSATPTNLTAFVTGGFGSTSSQIDATVSSATAEAAPDGVTVNFRETGYTGAAFSSTPVNLGTEPKITSALTSGGGKATLYAWVDGQLNDVDGSVSVDAMATYLGAVSPFGTPVAVTVKKADPTGIAWQTTTPAPAAGQTCTIRFKVTGGTQNPATQGIAGIDVDFTLTPPAGGAASLVIPSATTQSYGVVETKVAFPVPAPAGGYVVTATVRGTGFTANTTLTP